MAMAGPSTRGRVRLVLVAACTVAVACLSGAARAEALPSAPAALPQISGIEVDGGTLRALDGRAGRRMHALGVTLVAAPGRLSGAGKARLAAFGRRWRVPVVAPLAVGDARAPGPSPVASGCVE